MEQLRCMPGEVVKAEADYVFFADTRLKIGKPKLALTNKRLVWYETGITGRIKDSYDYPLSELLFENGVPQIFVKDSALNDLVVTIYFVDGQESFSTTVGYKAGLKKLISMLYQQCGSAGMSKSIAPIVGGAEVLADTVGETLGAFKKSLGIKFKRDEEMVCKCSSCGATISGKRGDVIECRYCGGLNKIV